MKKTLKLLIVALSAMFVLATAFACVDMGEESSTGTPSTSEEITDTTSSESSTPVDTSDETSDSTSDSGSGDPVEPIDEDLVELKTVGDTFSFTAENYETYITPVKSAISVTEKGLKVTKTDQWVAFETNEELSFGAGVTLKIEFEVTFIKYHDWDADNFFITFGEGAGEFKRSIQLKNIATITDRKHTVTTYVTLGEYDGYVASVSNYGGDSEYVFSKFTFTVVSEAGETVIETEPAKVPVVALANTGDTFEYTLANYADYTTAKYATLTATDAGIKVTKTNLWDAFETKNITFAAETIVKIELEVTFIKNHDWDAENFFVTFGEGSGEFKRSIQLKNIATITDRKHTITAYVTLGDYDGYVASVSNYGGDSEYVFNKFAFTVVSEAGETVIETEPAKVPVIALANTGDIFEFTTTNFGDYIAEKNATLAATEGGIKVTKTGQWVAFETKNITFAPNAIIKVAFEIVFTNAHAYDANNFFVTFGDGTAYSVSCNLTDISTVVARKHTIVRYYTLGDYDAYAMSFSNFGGGETIYTLSAFTLTVVSEAGDAVTETEEASAEVDLTAAGAKYTENFDSMTANQLADHFVSTGSANVSVDGGALKVQKTGIWQGLKGINFKFASGATYSFSFKLNVSQMNSTDFFELIFADGNDAEKVTQSLASYVTVGETVTVSFDITLKGDATEFLIGCWSGNAIYTIDDLVIERIA